MHVHIEATHTRAAGICKCHLCQDVICPTEMQSSKEAIKAAWAYIPSNGKKKEYHSQNGSRFRKQSTDNTPTKPWNFNTLPNLQTNKIHLKHG